MDELERLDACWEGLEGVGGVFMHEAEFWMNSGSAAEGGFGRRTCPTFVSGGDIRPPKVLPKVPCPTFLCLFCMHVLRCARGVLGSWLSVA